ncbi:hypothetical protein [Sphingomonas sp.]|uniref:hypothetical protein n=1 Tax=Sphingomonas sp. TaxID=28214 RepID=UPI003D6D0662
MLLLSIVSAVLGTRASAQDLIAPLPQGFAPSSEPKVHGLYAETEFGRIDVKDDLEALEAECKARGTDARVEGRELLWKGKRRLYRTPASVAVIEDTPTIKADRQACSATITLSRSVMAKSGPWSSIKTADWIDQHPKCARFPRCKTATIAGVKAQCVDLGDGLVGSAICYSLQDDLSKDLIVARSNYTDDGSGPDTEWALDLVLTDILIDPAVFAKTASR